MKVNRAAVGARVVVLGGERRQERSIQSGMSWASQCELSARFGLHGWAEIEAIEVAWPGGATEVFEKPARKPVITLVEGSGTRRKSER